MGFYGGKPGGVATEVSSNLNNEIVNNHISRVQEHC